MVGYGVIEMSKKMFIDKNGYLRGYIEKHDGIETPGFDEKYREIVAGRPGDGYVYNTITGEWVYEEPVTTDDPELTDSEALEIIVNGGDNNA